MSKYVREVAVDADLDGDDIKVRLRPMRFEDALTIRSGESEEGMLLRYSSLFPKYVISVQPEIVDADGKAIPLEEISEMTYFAQFIAKVMRKHFSAATPTDPTPPVEQPAG